MGNSRSKGSRTSRSGAKGPKAVRSREDDRVAVKVTFVVFRGEVNAIFRAVKDGGVWKKDGPFVNRCNGQVRYNAYAHTGQHGEVAAALMKCRRARPDEYLPLLKEMEETVGYDVEVVQRGRLRLKEETGYAACYLDEMEYPEAGVYKVFKSRGEALDYLVRTVFERSGLLGVDVIDMEGYEGLKDKVPRKMTPDEVRDALADGSHFVLGLEFDEFRTATRRTSMWVEEVTVS